MVLFLACAPAPAPVPAPDRTALARVAVGRAVGWMDLHADGTSLEIDVPIGLSAISARLPSAAAASLDARLRPSLDRPGDPRRRAYDPDARLPDPPPAAAAGPKLRLNAVFVEALHCAEHGFPPDTLTALCAVDGRGPRDGGGYGSAHAAWFLAEALDRGCVARVDTCADALRDELVEAPVPALVATLDRDLVAERLLFGLRIGADPAAVAPLVDALLAAQGADGGFGVAREREEPWWSWHATLAAAWGLSEWVARSEGR